MIENSLINWHVDHGSHFFSPTRCSTTPDYYALYRVYKKKRNLGISQEIDIVLKKKDFRRLGI
jgi:hypothetical protein